MLVAIKSFKLYLADVMDENAYPSCAGVCYAL